MQLSLRLFWLTLLLLKQPERSNTIMRKFVYQKDMSEYCKRRVMPSVFLGTHVAEAHSKILHFSNLEMPYSCSVSVRGELGSNVILVAQLLSEESLIESCQKFPDQLLVHEMGETFGGYWGPMPESMMLPSSTASKVYTHKYRQEPSSQKILTVTKEVKTTVLTTEKVEAIETPDEDFIEVELPIFNLSGQFENLPGKSVRPLELEDSFDLFYDVTPRSHEHYQTTEIPMLQFSIAQNIDSRRYGSGTRFDIEYGSGDLYTSHRRLTLPYFRLQTTTRTKYKKVRSFKRQKTYYSLTRKPTYTYSNSIFGNNYTSGPNVKTWVGIEEILNRLNETTSQNDKSMNENENISRILESISKLSHNYSAYLYPNWKSNGNIVNYTRNIANKFDFGLFTRKMLPRLSLGTRNIYQPLKSTPFFNFSNSTTDSPAKSTAIDKTRFQNVTLAGNVSLLNETTKFNKEIVDSKTYTLSNKSHYDNINNLSHTEYTDQTFNVTTPSVSTVIEMKEIINMTSPAATNSSVSSLSGTMVDHESWENVVQAAPVMAVRLNKTVTGRETYEQENVTDTLNYTTTKIRKKRRIQPIPIANARPHEIHTREPNETSQTPVFFESDLQELSQLVELQDDELHDRVALRFLRQYVGRTLFNICEFSEPKTRHIYLFNSSRIVISISNFTLERMTVMLTPARTLVSANAKCTDRSLECQVYGTRVCIDKTNACDGVPNCGAYDIYDEDRLQCGAAVGLKHNVYLAAVTFIAVLLTMLYTVHYWLKRCVPKVSEAFFIYTDKAENILYLESIMRSPHDVGDHLNIMSHEHMFMTDDLMYDNISNKSNENIFVRIWRGCIAFLTCNYGKNKSNLEDIENMMNQSTKTYSFTELELSSMGKKEKVDVSVQTGDSLDISKEKGKKTAKTSQRDTRRVVKLEIPPDSSDSEHRKHNMELQILKLLKSKKSQCEASCQCFESPDKTSVEEEELKSHVYTAERYPVTAPSSEKEATEYPPRFETKKHIVKNLRFDEDPYTIPNSDNEDEVNVSNVPLASNKTHKKVHDAGMSEGSDRNASTSKEHKRFWHTTKNKKSKKKTHLTLN